MAKKLTQEEVIKRFKNIHSNKYDYSLVEYKKTTRKVNIKCKTCNSIFEQTPMGHFNGHGCPKCNKNKPKTQKEHIMDFKKIHSDKYDYSLVEYKKANIPVKIKCKTCNNIFEQKPMDHKSGYGCKICSKSRLLEKNYKRILLKFKETHSNKYNYELVKYTGNRNNIEIICPEHGSFFQTPDGHAQGAGCPKCSKTGLRDLNKVLEQFKEKHSDKYDYSLVEYINGLTKVQIICHEKNCFGKEHGIFLQTPNMHILGSGCPKCAGLNKTLDEHIFEFKKVHGNKYDYSKVRYKNNKTKIEIICPEHGSFWKTPNGHKMGFMCPSCNNSRGEEKIREFLESNNIIYKMENRFKDLNKLPFDFYLEELNIAVEFDGEQHFKAIKFFGGEEGLKKTQERDKIKNDYCKNNNIELIRIPYTDFDKVEEILKEKICTKQAK